MSELTPRAYLDRVSLQRAYPARYEPCPACEDHPVGPCPQCLGTRKLSKGTARALRDGRAHELRELA